MNNAEIIKGLNNAITELESIRDMLIDADEKAEVPKAAPKSKPSIGGKAPAPCSDSLVFFLLPVKDEDLFPALFVDSSDVGRNMLTVRFGIYKQVCTNGLIISKADGVLYQQKHIGVKPDEFHENLVASLKKVESISQTISLRIELARSVGYDFDTWGESGFQDFMEDIRKKTKLSEQGAEKVVDFMKHKYGHTRWGYVNALTEVAQDYTLERRLEIEKLAGDILVA